MILAKLRRFIFHLRNNGIHGLIRYIKLDQFENKIFAKKKLKWNNFGYWEVDPMPTEKELNKFYSEIYWLNNQYYKDKLLIPRDMSHLSFLEKVMNDKMNEDSVFMNFGAGHGGISYLIAAKNMKVINIEPSFIFSGDFVKIKNFKYLDDFCKEELKFSKIDIFYSSHTIEHLPNPVIFFKKIYNLLNKNGIIFIEVPNCRRLAIDKNYAEGGCDGKITGSHLLYFTKDFFEKLDAKIYFFLEKDNGTKFIQVDKEDNADLIRAVITKESIKNWISKL